MTSSPKTREDRKTVAACGIEPVAVEGLRALLNSCRHGLEFAGATNSLDAGEELVWVRHPSVLVVDKAYGLLPVLQLITRLLEHDPKLAIVVWGASMTDRDTLRLLQAGARGIIRKASSLDSILTCLRATASGANWVERKQSAQLSGIECRPHSELTHREQQVAERVRQGLTNKEIANQLGIRPGTVKIHLKHVFEKTGARDRYSVALVGRET